MRICESSRRRAFCEDDGTWPQFFTEAQGAENPSEIFVRILEGDDYGPMKDGKPAGEYNTFTDGFAGADPGILPRGARHRPVGLAVGPDGSRYITDDASGRIWRVSYHPE